jgi:hypothetical protein
MTIYRTLLTRGYFPKELPPSFYSEQFAEYATSATGRATLASYQPASNSTECLVYNLALPGQARRELRILHPVAFAQLAGFVAKNFGRLLKIASSSPFAKSRPIYASNRGRAIQPMMSPSNLAKERAATRAGASFLLKADVSQFYPSLYTHAVGWAIDPKLRLKANWHNKKFLGAKIDQSLMDASAKVSQGVPIGNDISFLLAEGVLARVDRAVRFAKERAYRWFDDYEIAFDTKEQAESGLARLHKELDRFKLRLNPAKTRIVELPGASQESWQQHLQDTARAKFLNPQEMVRHFDVAFRLREEYPESPILLYAMGVLFKITRPEPEVGRIAQSSITQALLSEPGAAQKAFALLSFWHINGFSLNTTLIHDTICRMVFRHQWRGATSDVAWALAFCLEQGMLLNKSTARVLSRFDDDCILLQALHLHSAGLLPSGFSSSHIEKRIKDADLDREHWLLSYETARHGFLNARLPAGEQASAVCGSTGKESQFLPDTAPPLCVGRPSRWSSREDSTSVAKSTKEAPDGRRASDQTGRTGFRSARARCGSAAPNPCHSRRDP